MFLGPLPRGKERARGVRFGLTRLRRIGHPSLGMSLRRRYLFVCNNRRPDGAPKGSCAARGAVEIHQQLKALLEARGLAELQVRACTSSCLDACREGPAIVVEPDHFVYGRVTLEDVPEIVDALARGERVERLVLAGADWGEPRRG